MGGIGELMGDMNNGYLTADAGRLLSWKNVEFKGAQNLVGQREMYGNGRAGETV